MGDYLQAVLAGLGNVASPSGFLLVVAGTLLAMLMSFLPGIGTASLMTLVLLLTLSWTQSSVLLLFGALVGGATFMGSVTAILFNIPGSAPNAATLIDGYPLSRNGYTRTAIAAAATASGIGSLIGVLVLLGLLPFLSSLVPNLGPWEQLLLGIWGLTTIVALPATSKPKAALMCFLGLLAAMLGNDPINAQPRWHFGIDGMVSGLGIVPVLLGLFTFAEIISWQEKQLSSTGELKHNPEDSTRAGIRAVFSHPWLTFKSSIIGTLIGIIPGIGGTVAGFVAYSQAQASESDNETFGQGDIRGVIAPEAATDAKDGGSLVPAIALGLPGSEVGVFLIAVLAIHGVVPGEPMLNNQLPLTLTLIFALLLSNLLTSGLGIGLAPRLVGLSRIPLQKAALPILFISLLLIAQLNGLIFDLVTAVFFGFVGYFCKRWDWPRVPLVIAFVLGEYIERNLALSIRLMELGRIEPLQRPIAVVILCLVVASLFLLTRRSQSSPSNWNSKDLLFSGIAFLMCAALLVSAFLGNYSSYSTLLAITGSVLSAALFATTWYRHEQSGETGFFGSERSASLRLLSFITLPIWSWLVGLELAMGILVLGFFRSDHGNESNTLVRDLCWSFGAAALSYVIVNVLWQLQLNDAVLVGLFT